MKSGLNKTTLMLHDDYVSLPSTAHPSSHLSKSPPRKAVKVRPYPSCDGSLARGRFDDSLLEDRYEVTLTAIFVVRICCMQ
jgi:elongation factor P--beta-lysine ligase